MKSVLKRNQIMITALAIMIAVAGYLNFAGGKLEQEELLSADATQMLQSTDGSAVEVMGTDALSALEEDYAAAGVLEISQEDLEQAQLTDIESLDTDISVASADYLDEDMAETGAGAGAQLTEGEIPGEAVFTSSASVGTLSGAKLLKEQTRAKNKETLLEIINSESLTEAQKQSAVDNMIALTDIAEKEMASEILLEAKGFEDVVVSISNDMADIVVNASELTDAQRAQIEDVIKRKTGIAAENIIISPVIAN